MADRHAIAAQAIDVTDVVDLCRMLAHAAQDAMREQVYPHQDAACRVIACHLATVCNGDLPFYPHYMECYAYCCRQAEKDRLGAPDADKEKQPEVKPD